MLQAAHERWGAAVRFLGVNARDDRDSALALLADLHVSYPQAVDADGRLVGMLDSPGLPVTLVLDRRGAVAWRHVGEVRMDDLDRAVRSTTG
jgi:hypothetical protein